jgi:hypothetical protein
MIVDQNSDALPTLVWVRFVGITLFSGFNFFIALICIPQTFLYWAVLVGSGRISRATSDGIRLIACLVIIFFLSCGGVFFLRSDKGTVIGPPDGRQWENGVPTSLGVQITLLYGLLDIACVAAALGLARAIEPSTNPSNQSSEED